MRTATRAPTPAECGTAIDRGVRVVLGWPIEVHMDDGGVAIPDLVAASRGDPDPWHVTRQPAPGVVDLQTVGDRGLYIDGLLVGPADIGPVELSLRRAITSRRHSVGADAARSEAGRAALGVTDTMVRARLLDAVDGWAAYEESGTIVDRDDQHGVLVDPPELHELTCRVLVVTCPSTGRRYALRVPAECRTAREARLWTLDMDESPEVET